MLYHFRFKEELLTAANEHLVRNRMEAREVEAKQLPEGKNRRLKACVLASVKDDSGTDRIRSRLVVAGSMTAESAAPIRQFFKERFPPFAEDVGFDRTALVHAATESRPRPMPTILAAAERCENTMNGPIAARGASN